jgi:catechol 2,3-dioxygenase-like lactoylglutathione lyase family enzyme
MTILRQADLYHTGVVVPDLDRAMEELTELDGHQWYPAVTHPVPIWTDEGERTVTVRMVYSLAEPRLELIEAVAGTAWTVAEGNAVHHLGYLVDDLKSASDALTTAGYPMEQCGAMGPDRPSGFAYHRGPRGIRIELAPRTVLRDMESLL